MKPFAYALLLLSMFFCLSCYTDPSQDLFMEVNVPPKSDPQEASSQVSVLFASEFPVYPQPHTYLGTIRMNQKGVHRCNVDPLVFLRLRARKAGANLVYIKHLWGKHDIENHVLSCEDSAILADFLKVDGSLVRQYEMPQRTPDAKNDVKPEATKW